MYLRHRILNGPPHVNTAYLPHKAEELKNCVDGSHKKEYSSFYHQNSFEERLTSCSFHLPSQFPKKHLQPITTASNLYFYTTRQINYFMENNWGYPSQHQSHWK